MVTILGIQFPTTGKILHAPKTAIVSAYLKAMRDGKGQAEKVLKNFNLSPKPSKK